jgi:hypothetical protein
MARGWESKAVEAQMDAAQQERTGPNTLLTERQQAAQRERDNLMMARADIVRQIESSSNERYQQFLRETLTELERKIAALPPAA